MIKTKSKKEIFKELKTAGYRITKHRKTIINTIAGRPDHPSAKQVYHEIRSRESKLSLATIYNTLNMLVKLDILKEIEFDESDNRFDTNLSPHLNLICSICGTIIDYDYELPVSPETIKAENGFITKEYRIEYLGICHNCQDEF